VIILIKTKIQELNIHDSIILTFMFSRTFQGATKWCISDRRSDSHLNYTVVAERCMPK